MIKIKVISKILVIISLSILSGCLNSFIYIAGGKEQKGFVDGFIEKAKFNSPSKMEINEDNGDLYIIDQNNTTIRKITIDSKVSTIFNSNDKNSYISDLEINGNFLYFTYNDAIKRLDLNDISKVEDFIGSTSESGEINDNFKNSRFNGLSNICFISDYEMLIVDKKDMKLANLKSATVSFKNDLKVDNIYTSVRNIEFNKIDNKINILFEHHNGGLITLFELDNNNLKKSNKDWRDSFLSSFTIDNKGNTYLISIEKEHLIKIDNKNDKQYIESIRDILDVKEVKDPHFYPMESEPPITFIKIDNKRNILYMSYKYGNKLYKLKL